MAIQVLGDQSAARRDANVQITRSLLEVTAEVKNKYGGKMARSSHSTSTQTEHSRRKSEERRPFQAKTRKGMGVTMWVLPPEKQAPAVEAGPRTPGPRRGDDAVTMKRLGQQNWAIAENVTFRVITFPVTQSPVIEFPVIEVRRLSTQPPGEHR